MERQQSRVFEFKLGVDIYMSASKIHAAPLSNPHIADFVPNWGSLLRIKSF
jgi:hypothetical protein